MEGASEKVSRPSRLSNSSTCAEAAISTQFAERLAFATMSPAAVAPAPRAQFAERLAWDATPSAALAPAPTVLVAKCWSVLTCAKLTTIPSCASPAIVSTSPSAMSTGSISSMRGAMTMMTGGRKRHTRPPLTRRVEGRRKVSNARRAAVSTRCATACCEDASENRPWGDAGIKGERGSSSADRAAMCLLFACILRRMLPALRSATDI
eukprot:6177610-Pleurochrysis_carterae.AAC.3